MERYLVGSVAKALTVLDLFDENHKECTLTFIADAMNTKPGTIYPIVHTLEKFQYLAKDPDTKRYRLGFRPLLLASHILMSLDVREQAKPILEQLASEFSANAHLAIPYGNEVLYLERREAAPSVVLNSIIGRRVPLHCTALGKIFSAFTPHLEEWLLAQTDLKKVTPHTMTHPAEIQEELTRVRHKGFAVEREEFHEGNICYAAPIRNYRSKVFAAISISVAVTRADHEPLDRFTTAVVDGACRISEALGCAD